MQHPSTISSSIFGIRHLAAAIRGIESARVRTGAGVGLFAATSFDPSRCKAEITHGESQESDDNYALSWVRDTLKSSVYDLTAGHTVQVKETIRALLTYFRRNQPVMQEAIAAHQSGQPLKYNCHAVMPRMHPLTLEPIHADQEKDLQLDMAEFLKNLAIATRQGITCLRDAQDVDILHLFVAYLQAWDYSFAGETPGDFGIWEEGKGGTWGVVPDVHSSSIAAMLAGYLHVHGLPLHAEDGTQTTISISDSICQRGFEQLNHRLQQVGETQERPYDLTALVILDDYFTLKVLTGESLLTEENVQRLLGFMPKLERDRGFVRYASEENPWGMDDFRKGGSPEQKSAEWPMGFCYAALIYAALGDRDRAVAYIQKAEAVFDWETGLGLPEAYYGNTDTIAPVSPLTWANALYLTAYEVMRRSF